MMDLDNHKKHSFSNGRGQVLQCPDDRNLSLQCLQGPIEPKKTSRSDKCQKYCIRPFQNRCMYNGKAAKVATMHNPDLFIVGVNLVTVELPLQTVNV